MVKKGKTDVLATFLDKYGPELEQVGEVWGTLPEWMEESRTTPTLLHAASLADQADMVRWLLVEKRANPTVSASTPLPRRTPAPPPLAANLTVDTIPPSSTPAALSTVPNRPILTPYELAPSRGTRNVFRLLTTSNPDWWDWTGTGSDGARVPSGLTEDQEEERDKKGKDRRAKLRDKLKERDSERSAREALEKEKADKEEAEKKAKEEEESRKNGGHKIVKTGPQRLGGGPPRALVAREMDAAGLTEEQRMRIAREQRARAAELRMAKP